MVIFAINTNPCSAGYDASKDIIAQSNVYARREEGSETAFTDFYSPDPSFLSVCNSAPRVVGFSLVPRPSTPPVFDRLHTASDQNLEA